MVSLTSVVLHRFQADVHDGLVASSSSVGEPNLAAARRAAREILGLRADVLARHGALTTPAAIRRMIAAVRLRRPAERRVSHENFRRTGIRGHHCSRVEPYCIIIIGRAPALGFEQ